MSDNIQERWFKPVNRLGRFTLVVAMFLSFLPFLYLVIRFGVMPPLDAIGLGIFNVGSAFIAGWIVEPISYFPSLGTAGTYMGILAGSIGQMRVPSALVAKSVAGVKENTQEAEIVGTCGIAGSVLMNCIFTTVTALAGSVIIAMLPEVVLSALSAYVLPALFGAVLAMFTSKGKLPIAVIVLIAATLLNYTLKIGLMPALIGKFGMPLCVVIGVLTARAGYKAGWVR